ncbi:NAD dependent epimerase/dehydratase [Aulographum hederae CBS 113979]|uniref:NAD dependent epimerase/dehydratase n=1 Tax=Aulographum hederae CBS 113979 TaxID=1176131 RepID=A0A6G1HD27_9PEZI|nr:NAD dependent epimerase/dehydratase [Aulographum hederae CBS 113979]
MSSQDYPLRNSGIYHNLPQFSPAISGLTAIITGANGISGFGTLRALLDSPLRWSKIYTISRSPPPDSMLRLLPEHALTKIQFIPIDFLSPPTTIAAALNSANIKTVDYIFYYTYAQPPPEPGAGAWSNDAQLVTLNASMFSNFLSALNSANIKTVDYIFYYTYAQPPPEPGAGAWSNDAQLVTLNASMFSNFLSALPLASLTPKRILLQTGAKNYGAHLGPVKEPCCESDPQPRDLAPNFYYAQEDLLKAYSERNPATGWNVIRPPWIVGAVAAAAMNPIFPFAVYAAVQAQRGLPLVFPGSVEIWNEVAHRATAVLTGFLSEWVVLEKKCGDQAFNSQDTSPVTWTRFWEELVRWFGVERGFEPPKTGDDVADELVLGEEGRLPLGYGLPQKTKYHFTLTTWAADPSNAAAWKEIMNQHDLLHDPFADPAGNFTFGDMALNRDPCLSMNKARRLGWTGMVDTLEAIFEMYQEMGQMGYLPLMRVGEAKALV